MTVLDDDRLAYSITDAARIIGVSRPTVYRLLGEGAIEARKVRGRTLIRRVDLQAYLDSCPVYEPEGAS